MEKPNYINEVSIIKCDKENHYIYISDKFFEDIDSTGIDKDVVDKFIDILKSSTDPFKYGEPLKFSNLFRQKRDALRLLFQSEIIDSYNFVVLRSILRPYNNTKDKHQYNAIKKNPDNFINEFNNSKELLISTFKNWEKEQQNIQKQCGLKKASQNEIRLNQISKWIDNFKINFDFDVYETAEWKQSSFEKLDTYGSDFLKILEQIIVKKDIRNITHEQIPHPQRLNIFKAVQGNICILYERFTIDGESKYLLYNSFEKYNEQSEQVQRAIETILNNSRFQFTIIDGNYEKKEVSRCAERAYPSMILDIEDREIWFDIQKSIDDNANLSLLPDQIELLENIKFPFFINGQAGSGKSTMLYYLFAQLCYKKLIEPDSNNTPQNEIIFITDNQYLLKNSLKEIAMLLRKNPQYSLDIKELYIDLIDPEASDTLKNEIIQDALEKQLNKYFSSFIHFLRNKLENPDNNFPLNQYIDFYRFREAYLHSRVINKIGHWEQINTHIPNQIKKKYSPEVAWYIIRTFIKGYKSSKELEEDDFGEIPRNDRGSLDNETYKEVYKEVYEKFYKKLMKKGYWDNIDLIKMLIEQKNINSNFSVIICDEAQDFTKVELQILIKFSEFHNYDDLSRKNSFPVIFAGDPFQTVNPTGFSWTRLKSMFTEDIVQKFHLSINIEDRFEELKMNYRSTPMIVKIANMIQYFRRAFLLEHDIKFPQIARQYKDNQFSKPALIEIENNLSGYENSRLGLNIFIAPCESGGEEDFVKADGLKADLFIIRSAAFLKGLEHDTIIIYKFGQHFIDEILLSEKVMQLLNRNNIEENAVSDGTAFPNFFSIISSDDFKDDDIKFKAAYFFNKLYVAVTRAKKELVIMDTQKGINSFWMPFIDNIKQYLECEPNLSEKCGDQEKNNSWRYQILENQTSLDVLDSNSDYKKDITRTQQTTIAIKQAEEYFKKATEKGAVDSVAIANLQVAIQYYKRSGLSKETEDDHINMCEAHIAMIEMRWKEAGELFNRAGDKQKAVECYWKGGCWKELTAAAENDDMLLVAKLMQESKIELSNLTANSKKLSELFAQNQLSWISTFTEKLIQVLGNIVKKSKSSINNEEYKELADSIVCLNLSNYKCTSFAAEIYFELEMFDKAIELWDKHREENNIRFLYSVAITTDNISNKFSTYFNLYKLVKKNKTDEKLINLKNIEKAILSLYNSNKEFHFDKNQCADIADILLPSSAETAGVERIEEVLELFFRNSRNKSKSIDADYTDLLAQLVNSNPHTVFVKSLLQVLNERAKKNPLYVQMLGADFYNSIIRISNIKKITKKIIHHSQEGSYQICEDIMSRMLISDTKNILGILIKILAYASEIEPEFLKSKNEKPIPLDHLILSFSKYYIKNKSSLSQLLDLSYEEIANAIERTNRQYSVISRFYDTDIFEQNYELSTKTKCWLQDRWLKVKHKQYKMDSSSSGMADSSKTSITLNKFISQWGLAPRITLENIEKDSARFPEYPKLDKILSKNINAEIEQTHNLIEKESIINKTGKKNIKLTESPKSISEHDKEQNFEDRQDKSNSITYNQQESLINLQEDKDATAINSPSFSKEMENESNISIHSNETVVNSKESVFKITNKYNNNEISPDIKDSDAGSIGQENIQKKNSEFCTNQKQLQEYQRLYFEEKKNSEVLKKTIDDLSNDIKKYEDTIEQLKIKLENSIISKDIQEYQDDSVIFSGSEDIIKEINIREMTLKTTPLPEVKAALDTLIVKLLSNSIEPAINKALCPILIGLQKTVNINITWQEPYEKINIEVKKNMSSDS